MLNQVQILKKFIEEDNLQEALQLLGELLPNQFYQNQVTLLLGRYSHVKNDLINGTGDNSEIQRELNKIRYSILELTQKVEINNEEPVKNFVSKDDLLLLIKTESKSTKYYVTFSVGLVIIGFICAWFGSDIKDDTIKLISKLGGGLISSLSGFPIKEVIGITKKIGTLKLLAIKLDTLVETMNSNYDEIIKIQELYWKIIEKNSLT